MRASSSILAHFMLHGPFILSSRGYAEEYASLTGTNYGFGSPFCLNFSAAQPEQTALAPIFSKSLGMFLPSRPQKDASEWRKNPLRQTFWIGIQPQQANAEEIGLIGTSK
jgi:hypothetical protein